MENNTSTGEAISFMTIAKFKEQIGAINLNVLKNPNTGKLFLTDGEGNVFKVQQDIKKDEEMKMLIKDNNITDACLVNVKNSAEQMFSL